MGRLRKELIERVEALAHRVLDVADKLESLGKSARIVEQITGAGTSAGANICEADEAVTRPMFVKCLAIALQELAETAFWIRLVGKRGWIKPSLLEGLERETIELRKILGSMIVRTKRKPALKSPPA
jgi:four helix bundle protein